MFLWTCCNSLVEATEQLEGAAAAILDPTAEVATPLVLTHTAAMAARTVVAPPAGTQPPPAAAAAAAAAAAGGGGVKAAHGASVSINVVSGDAVISSSSSTSSSPADARRDWQLTGWLDHRAVSFLRPLLSLLLMQPTWQHMRGVLGTSLPEALSSKQGESRGLSMV